MAPPRWTPLHERLKEIIGYDEQQNYEKCGAIIDILSNRNSLDAFNVNNANLLFYSFRDHDLPVMKMLLEAGADPCIANPIGITLLHIMAGTFRITCRSEVTRHLLELYASMDSAKKSAFVNAVDQFDTNPLMAATNFGNYSIAKWLLDNDANVNAESTGEMTKGWTATHEAAKKGHKNVLRLLLQNGADPNSKTSTNLTPRDVARGNKDIIDLLDSFD